MSLNYNKVILAGNLTRDPEVKTAGQSTVAKFGLAINRRYKKDNEVKEETTFVDIEAWDKLAQFAGQYLTKGSGAMVEGKLKLDTWEKDGVKQSKLKVVADTIQFTTAKADGEKAAPAAAPAAKAAPAKAAAAPVYDDGGVPF